MKFRFAAAGLAILGSLVLSTTCPAAIDTDPARLPFLHAAGTAIADEQGQPVVLRGCNLGNWLLLEPWMWGFFDRPDLKDQAGIEKALLERFGPDEKERILDLYRENWITGRDYAILKDWGFNVVRLPFNGSLLEDDAHPGELKPDAFRWLDRAVELARQAGVYVILDLHGAPGGQSLDGVTGKAGRNQFWRPENRHRGAFIWLKIAEHFRDNPTVAAYDLLNEPYGMMNSSNHDADLVASMDEMIHAIRQVDTRHLVFCSGSLRGIEMYGNPQARGWQNVGFTEHFYPGVYGGTPSLATHARFIGSNLEGRARLLSAWNVPYFAGEFNTVFESVAGADMMRCYYDVFQSHGWAATLWAYKLIKTEGGVHPNHWYMVTNGQPLRLPDFQNDSASQIETFCRALGTMEYAQATDLRDALTAKQPASLILANYSPVVLPQKCVPLPGWSDADIGQAFPKGGHTMDGSTVEVFGGGRDIYEGSDEFHFVSHPVAGDFSLKAGVTVPTDTHVYAKSGLMFRASSAPDAPFVMINLFPEGRCVCAYRDQPGKRVASEDQLCLDPKTTALRLARQGVAFELTAFDKDGATLATKTFDLPGFVGSGKVGLFVLSHDAMLLSEAKFSRVQLETSKLTTSLSNKP